MSLFTQTVEPVVLDVSNQANWYVEIADFDEDGADISHSGEDLRATLRDNDDEEVLDLDAYISLKPGANNTIVIDVPWSVVKDIEPGEYPTTIVNVVDADNREEVLPLVFRQTSGPTRA